MSDYKAMYYTLFHATTDAIELLHQFDVKAALMAEQILMKAQQDCEEIYIDSSSSAEEE